MRITAHSELMNFSSDILKSTMFQQLDLLLSSGEGVEDTYSVGPLE
jgi:hypothetical protein